MQMMMKHILTCYICFKRIYLYIYILKLNLPLELVIHLLKVTSGLTLKAKHNIVVYN